MKRKNITETLMKKLKDDLKLEKDKTVRFNLLKIH